MPEIRLGIPKAAAHVAVRPSVLVTVKCYLYNQVLRIIRNAVKITSLIMNE